MPPLFRGSRLVGSALGAAALTLALAFPAHLDLGEQTHLHAMLTSLSLHGLPGMAAGLVLNGAVLAAFALIWRRLGSSRNRRAAAAAGRTRSPAAVARAARGLRTASWPFSPYGCGVVFGTPLPPDFCGGRVVLDVTLLTPLGSLPGRLTIYCLIGAPPASASEGIRLVVPGVINFNKVVGGENVYIKE